MFLRVTNAIMIKSNPTHVSMSYKCYNDNPHLFLYEFLPSFLDIAVGAPWEDGHGAVYIYLGSPQGLRSRFSQHLLPQDFSAPFSGFGMSISRGIDIDQNGYPGNVLSTRERDVCSVKKGKKNDVLDFQWDPTRLSSSLYYNYRINLCKLRQNCVPFTCLLLVASSFIFCIIICRRIFITDVTVNIILV